MQKNHNLEDIGKAIEKGMNDVLIETGIQTAIDIAGIYFPVKGIAAKFFYNIANQYSDFKLQYLLSGLVRKENTELILNKLYGYVNDNPENAITVANLFKKVVNAECQRVCFIYGLILSEHICDDSRFSRDELIVCRALENATEYDLINFRKIMEKYLKNIEDKKRIVFPEKFSDKEELIVTCEWCVYNRIFGSMMTEWGDLDENKGDVTPYYVMRPAEVLIEYIRCTRQIWEYGDLGDMARD